MKYFFILIIASVFSLSIKSQDCKTLDGFRSFHGLKIGGQFPDSLKKHFKFEMINGNTDSSFMTYSLALKDLDFTSSVYLKLYQWFQFGEINFTNLSFDCLPDGRIYEFNLIKLYDATDETSQKDSVEIENNRIPKTILKTSEELTSLFGKMTKTENETDFLGYHLYRIWECEKNKILLSLWYSNHGNLPKYTLFTELTFTDKNLEKINKLWKYQH